MPSSLSLLIANFAAGSARSRALAAYGAMAGMGFVVGMVGGGLITELLGWRWISLLNIPIVMIMLLPVRGVLPESRNTSSSDSIDGGGAVTVTLGLILLIFSITSAPRHGWLAPETWSAGLLGLAFAVSGRLASASSSTAPHPLVAEREFCARDLLGPLQHAPALRHTLAKAQDSTSENRGIDDKCHHLRSRQYGNGDR